MTVHVLPDPVNSHKSPCYENETETFNKSTLKLVIISDLHSLFSYLDPAAEAVQIRKALVAHTLAVCKFGTSQPFPCSLVNVPGLAVSGAHNTVAVAALVS